MGITILFAYILSLFLRKCLLFNRSKVPFNRFNIYSDALFGMSNYTSISACMRYTNFGEAVLKEWPSVVMMPQIHFPFKTLIKKRSYCKKFFSPGRAARILQL